MTVIGDKVDDKADNITTTSEAKAEEIEQETKSESNMFDDPATESEIKTDEESKKSLEKANLPGRMNSTTEERIKINTDTYTPNDLTITPAEKAAFIDALITGDRYRQKYQLFGGRLAVTIRSRIAPETNAMYSYIRYRLAKGGKASVSAVEGDMAYVPLVVQIEELNGVKYPEMKAPLTFEESDGKEVPPGWLEDFKAWRSKSEGLTSALISCIQLFEYKYWTMVREATSKNFWNSDTSTAE